MAYNPQGDSAKLMKLYNQEVKLSPDIPDQDTLLLRARLILEEALEFVEAAGLSPRINDTPITMNEIEFDPSTPDLEKMADAIGDILVVTYGALNSIGVQAEPLMEEIARSNWSKVFPDGTVHKNEYGKVVKPASYSPPNIKAVLTRCKYKVIIDNIKEAYPSLAIACSKGMNMWSWMAAEAYGGLYKFTYNTAQQVKDVGDAGIYARVLLARKAIKAIIMLSPSEISDHRLAKYLGTTDAIADELLTLFEARFPKVSIVRPKKEDEDI